MEAIIKELETPFPRTAKRQKDLFIKIKNEAIANPNGFGENRKKIYSYLLQLEEINPSSTVITLTSSLEFKTINTSILPNYFDKHKRTPQSQKDLHLNNKNIEILKKDLPRCIIHHIQDNSMKIDMDDFERCITLLLLSDKLNYSFYQGYLDICVYMFLLFPSEKRTHKNKGNPYSKALASLNRITEILLKDYISMPEVDNDTFNQAVNFLAEIIGLNNKEIGNKLKKDNCCLCIVISWVLTLMTHDINDPHQLYRLLDYLIVAESYAIYVFVALVVHDKLVNASKENEGRSERKLSDVSQSSQSGVEKYYTVISGIKVEELDFNKYIEKTEEFIQLNTKEINLIREKYKKGLKTICNVEYKGTIDFLIPPKRKKKWAFSYFLIAIAVLLMAIVVYCLYFPRKASIES